MHDRVEQERIFRKLSFLPFHIPILVLTICVYGFIILYSASGGSIYPWAIKQMMVFVIFMPISILISLVDLRLIYRYSDILYIISVILLIMVSLLGKTAMGGNRWLNLGIFYIQPSDIMKISLILTVSRYFHLKSQNSWSDYTLIYPIIASLIPILLIIKQPDLGTAIILLAIVITIFLAYGLKLIYFIIIFIISLLSLPLLWLNIYDYQRNRILAFFDQESDPLGIGYNIIQSKIAIGSGGLLGKGFLSGTQTHLKFLPEYHTDFIFAFLTEELGFIGGFILIFLYAILIFQTFVISINSRVTFGALTAIGISTFLFLHVFINIAMIMGLIPVVGVPLPFISYGRTMMASMLIGYGLVMNVALHKRSNL